MDRMHWTHSLGGFQLRLHSHVDLRLALLRSTMTRYYALRVRRGYV